MHVCGHFRTPWLCGFDKCIKSIFSLVLFREEFNLTRIIRIKNIQILGVVIFKIVIRGEKKSSKIVSLLVTF